jgi:hypothetical protein
MLGHHEHRRGARARLLRIALVPAMEREEHAWLVNREHRRPRVPRLLEVVRPRVLKRV